MPLLTYQQARVSDDEAEHRKTSPDNKRLLSDQPLESTKRRKITDATALPRKETIDGIPARGSPPNPKVDPTELASAFALASLASLSPGGSADTPPRESREVTIARKESSKDEVRKAASFESETRSPRGSEHPSSPEQRSQEDATSTVGISSPSRRVSFAPNTKTADEPKTEPSTPTISKDRTTSRQTLAMPQESPRTPKVTSPNSAMMMQISPRPHRMYGGRGLPPFVRTPLHPHQRMMYGSPPPPPHGPYHPRMGHRGSFRHGPPPMHPHISSPYMQQQQQQQQQYGMRQLPPHHLMQPALMHKAGMAPVKESSSSSSSSNQWICDYCNVASFSSYEEACAHEEICKRSGPKAAAYLAMSRSYSAASMDEDSAPMSAMMGGHHFPPPMHHPGFGIHHHAGMTLKMGHQQHRSTVNGPTTSRPPKEVAPAKKREEQQPMTEEEKHRQELHLSSLGGYIVYPNDMEMIPPYVHFLMRQVEPCLFTEADRFVARSKGPVGYPGFQCRHCHGHAGLGKYFPVSSKSLSTNSTSQNIHAHMLKCRKCPDAVKDRLVQLKIEKSKAARLEPGWRKVFFDKVWKRLHPDSEVDGTAR